MSIYKYILFKKFVSKKITSYFNRRTYIPYNRNVQIISQPKDIAGYPYDIFYCVCLETIKCDFCQLTFHEIFLWIKYVHCFCIKVNKKYFNSIFSIYFLLKITHFHVLKLFNFLKNLESSYFFQNFISKLKNPTIIFCIRLL